MVVVAKSGKCLFFDNLLFSIDMHILLIILRQDLKMNIDETISKIRDSSFVALFIVRLFCIELFPLFSKLWERQRFPWNLSFCQNRWNMTSLWRHSRLMFCNLGADFFTQYVELMIKEMWWVRGRYLYLLGSYSRKRWVEAVSAHQRGGRPLT